MFLMTKELELKFDPNTIEHLGISLYSKLPSVLSELISNSWDADADMAVIDFIDTPNGKEICYFDDGQGMNFDELNDKYLMIGRNRRRNEGDEKTQKGRNVIGKKGLGKLSVFGICDEVDVMTVKYGIKNQFVMNIDKIKSSKTNSYKPQILAFNQPTTENSGTTIRLKKIRRKTGFKIKELAQGLSKKFLIFDDLHTSLTLNGKNEVVITNEMKFSNFNIEFTWDMPSEIYSNDYDSWNEVRGRIITLETPIKDTEMKGVYLTSRGKIVNIASFYGLRDTDQFHNYVTGYLEVDFIDDLEEDLISTDRQSLNWEHDVTKELQRYLQKVIKKIGRDWRKKRGERKILAVKEKTGLDIQAWQDGLPSLEKELAEKIIDPVLENANIGMDETGSIIGGVINKFDNASFKEYAHQIASSVSREDIPQFLKLIDEWKTIEAKQFSDLALSRIEVIKRFEQYLESDTKEVPTLHNFLKQFSWLLDPRILEFKDEVKYSQLLKESYPEDKLDEQDRRIDFLCSNALGKVLYVIEIKRSKYKVDVKALDQAFEYGVFLKDRFASESGFSNVVCYVVGGEKSTNSLFKSRETAFMNSAQVFVKTYPELLEQSKVFHKEFIDAYKGLP